MCDWVESCLLSINWLTTHVFKSMRSYISEWANYECAKNISTRTISLMGHQPLKMLYKMCCHVANRFMLGREDNESFLLILWCEMQRFLNISTLVVRVSLGMEAITDATYRILGVDNRGRQVSMLAIVSMWRKRRGITLQTIYTGLIYSKLSSCGWLNVWVTKKPWHWIWNTKVVCSIND